MEDGSRANLLSAAFPAPPPFYKNFTPDNVAQLQLLKDEAKADANNNAVVDEQGSGLTDEQFKNLLPELLYLIPPEPPKSGLYQCFGEAFDISNPLPSLHSRGIEQLFPTPPTSPPTSPSFQPTHQNSTLITSSNQPFDRANELITLSRSLLFSFLELITILSTEPGPAATKIEDLRVLFMNIHYLVNGYRPHQARETVIEMVREQIRKRREEIEGVKSMQRKVEEVLGGLGQDVVGVGEEVMVADGGGGREREDERRREERERAVWSALDEIEV